MQVNTSLPEFDPTQLPPASIELLGEITVPSGELLVIDTGTLYLWSHNRAPLVEDGTFPDPKMDALVNSAVDLKIEGDDAVQAGLKFNRQWHPEYLYDIPAHAVEEMKGLFDQALKGLSLNAQLTQLSERISHCQRIDLALEYGQGQGEVHYHGMTALTISSLPKNQAMKVYGVRMNHPRYSDRWRWVWLEVRPELQIAQSRLVGRVAVDHARLMFADVEALGEWAHNEPLDGKADLLFWGKDAEIVAEAIQAPQHSEGYGWVDLSLEGAVKHWLEIEELKEAEGLKLAADFRPHSHHYYAMQQVRASETASGVVEVGGARMCIFMTSWGDGYFPVISDLAEDGQLIRLRIDLGNEEAIETSDYLNSDQYSTLM